MTPTTPKNEAMYTMKLLRSALALQNLTKEYWFREETLEAMTRWGIEKEEVWQLLVHAEICDVLKHDTNYHAFREEVLVFGMWLLPMFGIDEYAYTKVALVYHHEKLQKIKLLSFKPLVANAKQRTESLKLWHTDMQLFMDWNRDGILATFPDLCFEMNDESFTIQIARTLLEIDPRYMKYIPEDCLTQTLVEKAVVRDERCGNMIPDELMSLRAFYYAIIYYPELVAVFPEHVDAQTVPYFVKVQPHVFPFLPKDFQTTELAELAVEIEPTVIAELPKVFLTQSLVNRALAQDSTCIRFVDNKYKTAKNCYHIVKQNPDLWEYVPSYILKKLTA